MKTWIAEIKTSLLATAALAVLLCGVYPLAVHLLGRGLFPGRADGSLIGREGAAAGSSLIGRAFAGPAYFHSRPSAAGAGYDGTASGGSNLGPLSRTLSEAVARRAAAYREENGLPAATLLPADAVTASASGLDPHISPANARLQAARVARARGWAASFVLARLEAFTEGRDLGFLGEPRVNVLLLNLDLDGRGHDGR
jgi:K+-transporting ATPase ATPase C chain